VLRAGARLTAPRRQLPGAEDPDDEPVTPSLERLRDAFDLGQIDAQEEPQLSISSAPSYRD
jgi:hypothetical protein